MNVKPLLDFIAQFESGGNYNVVWGRIKPADRPKRPLVTMTIAEVLAWQESIDARYQSEAAGRYQIMEDTLRPLPASAGLLAHDLFNEANQDALATVLLRRRGLDKFTSGQISVEEFANNLAREWASLPVVSGPKAGRSFYAGDGLNKSHVSVADFMAAVAAVKAKPPAVQPDPIPDPVAKPSIWAALFETFATIFRKGA
jgi:muramidase (phage lysozyme)